MLPILEKIYEECEYYPTIKEVRQWFGVLNEIIFESRIPKFYNIEIKSFRGQFAACLPCTKTKEPFVRCSELQIDYKFHNFRGFITILAHEMIHAWEWKTRGYVSHGKNFFQWKQKLLEHGIPLKKCYHRHSIDKIT